jgi:hypothetical protein
MECRFFMFLLLAYFFGACPASSFQSARTLPEGETRYLAGVEFNGAGTKGQGAIELPQLAFGVRHGEQEGFELGFTATALPLGNFARAYGIELNTKTQLRSTPEKKRDMALGSALGYHYISSSQAPALQVGYLNFSLSWGGSFGSRGHHWVLAPSLGGQLLVSRGVRPVLIGDTGITLGAEWRLSKVWLLTQLSAYGTLTGVDGSRGSVLTHQSLGISWGKK